ncbi:MAG: 2-deoxycytidine 5-triphosphate deaminase [Mucilaginibacter sp.]|nr:2-deoxycytidine 5-triphosphate deaminase [Mucilaginibacter sp.]
MIWKEKNWIPGVLSKRQLNLIIEEGFIKNAKRGKDLAETSDHSSMDLHLSGEGYEMIDGSIKPCGGEYRAFYSNKELATPLIANKNGEFSLLHNHTYVFKIEESFSPLAKDNIIYAQATAKSSIGRLDVVARLIVDGMHAYEYMDPKDISTGDMFLEITPITFNIKVKKGDSLSQIRFFIDEPSKAIIPNLSISEIVLKGDVHKDGTLAINLENEKIGEENVAAFLAIGAKDNNEDFISISGKEKLDPNKYWKCMPSNYINGKHRLTILPDKFYILRSKERISLPKGVAVYCQAMDETLGEMRIHYAGFAHPFFGETRNDEKKGTPLIFEVRGHNVKVNLTDGEKLARLVFYRMSEDCFEEGDNQELTLYNNQELTLSKYFDKWTKI